MIKEAYKLNFWGEFRGKLAEGDYQTSISHELRRHNRFTILVAGLTYWVITVGDFAKLGFSQGVYMSASLRMIYLLMCVVFFIIMLNKGSFALVRNLTFTTTIVSSIVLLMLVYFLNPDGKIDAIDQITVPIVTLLCYAFMNIPLAMLLFNGVLITVLYVFLMSFLLKESVDNTINMVAMLGAINFMGFFLIRFFNITKRNVYVNNQTIAELNQTLLAEIEERTLTQNNLEDLLKQITDSIRYAQKIQFALLPDNEVMRNNFKENALFFRPRDIVSGDFYWVYEMEGKTIVAAADCTGHGIPGAFMSVLGISLLNDIVKSLIDSNSDITPDIILDRLRAAVIRSLQQDAKTDRRDGIDISLLIIDPEIKEIQYAGAYSSMWLVRKVNDKASLIEVKGDRMPVGMHSRRGARDFNDHVVNYNEDDVVYLFSDGYKDQFGGDEGKKFLVRRMRSMILSNHNLPLEKQQKVWEDTFDEWKGEYSQVDDILLMAFKL